MVKEPRPGRVKRRLGKDIGMTSAACWFRHQTRSLLRRLRDPRWEIILAVSPDREGLSSKVWPRDLVRLTQGRGNLGQRMARVLGQTHGPSVLIGADIPGVERRHIARAFVAMGNNPAVIGPASDGGYWLIGLRRPSRQRVGLFEGVRWSTPDALADTLPTLPQPVVFADKLKDVDSGADLAATRERN